MPSASGITFEGGGDGRGADWLGEKTQPEGTAVGFRFRLHWIRYPVCLRFRQAWANRPITPAPSSSNVEGSGTGESRNDSIDVVGGPFPRRASAGSWHR